MTLWKNILLVALGGSLGAVARYLCQKFVQENTTATFPFGTFAVNITGCLLIGLFIGLTLKNPVLSEDLKLFLMTGFCGGFTTFSAFTAESMTLLQQQKVFSFFVYITASVVIGLSATFLGYWIAK